MADACTVTLNIVGDYVAKGSEDDAVAMDIGVSGTAEGVVELTKGYTGTGRVAIWNADREATITQVNVTACPVRLWVQGTTESSAIPDVTVTATLKVGGQTKDTDSDTVTVVKVDKIQYNDPDSGYTDVTGTLYVMKGTTVTFKAIPDPSGASWPSGKPVWGGTSGASGTGSTKDVTFNTKSSSTADFKTVTAECGNTVTVNVIVYSLTGKHVAQDYFDDRATIKYGAAEVVNLSFTVSPTGITAAQMGGLAWSKVAGSGTLQDNGNGLGTYTCHWTTDSVTLRLTVQAGPSKNKYVDMGFSVVPPSDGYMIQKPGTNIWHIINTASVGFKGWSYLRPKDVSFTNIQRREGGCFAVATGFYAYQNGLYHPVGAWWEVSNGNSTTGCRVECDDTVQADPKGPPYSVGEFNWPIPRQYRVGTGGATTFYTANQHKTANAIGTAQYEKAEAGPFSKNAGDASSDY